MEFIPRREIYVVTTSYYLRMSSVRFATGQASKATSVVIIGDLNSRPDKREGKYYWFLKPNRVLNFSVYKKEKKNARENQG